MAGSPGEPAGRRRAARSSPAFISSSHRLHVGGGSCGAFERAAAWTTSIAGTSGVMPHRAAWARRMPSVAHRIRRKETWFDFGERAYQRRLYPSLAAGNLGLSRDAQARWSRVQALA
jgi:hypothetical protein